MKWSSIELITCLSSGSWTWPPYITWNGEKLTFVCYLLVKHSVLLGWKCFFARIFSNYTNFRSNLPEKISESSPRDSPVLRVAGSWRCSVINRQFLLGKHKNSRPQTLPQLSSSPGVLPPIGSQPPSQLEEVVNQTQVVKQWDPVPSRTWIIVC